jgi:hypothetical protein
VSKGSYASIIKRRAMKEARLSFTDRLREAVRTGKPMTSVLFKVEGKKVLAIEKK